MRKVISMLFVLSSMIYAQETRAFYIQYMHYMSPSYCASLKEAVYAAPNEPPGYLGQLNNCESAPNGAVFDGLLQRLKNAGYNAIVSEMPLEVFRIGPERKFYFDAKDRNGNSIKVLKEVMERADRYGLAVIPLLPVNSTSWVCGWRLASLQDTTLNVISSSDDRCSTPTGPNAQFDTVLVKLLRRMKQEYTEAKLVNTAKSAVMPIWLSNDEYWFSSAAVNRTFLGQTSLSDRRALTALRNQGNSWSKSMRILHAKSLLNRLRLVRKELGSSAKYYTFANSFISQTSDGGVPWTLWNGEKACFTGEVVVTPTRDTCSTSGGEQLVNLPGLSSTEKTDVKSGIIMAPWFYFDVLWNPTRKADIEGAMNNLRTAGFSILPYFAFDHADEKTANGSAVAAMREMMIYPRTANINNRGYVSAVYPGSESRKSPGNWGTYWWRVDRDIYEQIPEYQVIEAVPPIYSGNLVKKIHSY